MGDVERITTTERHAEREQIAQAAYEAFAVASASKIGQLPPFDSIGPAKQDWLAVADAVLPFIDQAKAEAYEHAEGAYKAAARAVADAVLAAVADDLRLEGAQAEHERVADALEPVARAVAEAEGCTWTPDCNERASAPCQCLGTAAAVLAALGGVHPEAQDPA